MKKASNLTNNILNSKKYVLSIFCSFLVLTFAWLNIFTGIDDTANAQGLDTESYSQLIAFGSDDGSSIKQKAKSDFDTILGAGSSDKVEGKAEQALGNVEQSLGKVTGQAKGVAKQVEGRAKQDIGRTKDAAQDAASDVEDKTDNAVDSIRDFFSN